MGSIAQQTQDLKSLPDQALQGELAHPSGIIPGYLVLAEAQRRQLTRQAQQQQQDQQGASGSVLDDVLRNMNAQQPPGGPAPVGMSPSAGSPPTPGQTPTPTPPQPPPKPPGMASGGPIRFAAGGPTDDDVDGWIDQYSNQYGVDPNLARAVMGQESGSSQRAVSPVGAIGRFQLMPATARGLGVDPHDPQQNVEGGVRYLGQLYHTFGGDLDKTLAAYNAGPTAVLKYHGIPPFPETMAYVPSVKKRYFRLGQGLPPATEELAQLNQQEQQPQQQPQQPQAAPQQPPPQSGQPDVSPGAGSTPGPELAAILNSQPDIPQPPGAAPDQPTFSVTSHPGRIHQNIADLQTTIDDINKRIGALPDPYADENVQTMRKLIDPNDHLSAMSRQLDMRAATLDQLQGRMLDRYQNPNPWEFLANIAAGMGSSKSVSLPMMFAQGVGQAWKARDEEQQTAMSDYDALERERDSLYNNLETQRSRYDTTLASFLEHQSTVTEANRKLLQDQLKTATTEQGKWKQMLVPTNKLQPFYNPDDYPTEEVERAKDWAMKNLKWTPARANQEANAIQMLAQRGDPFQQGGNYATAYDQFLAKYPQEATKLQAKPSKYSDGDIARWVTLATKDPSAYFTPETIPKDALPQVQAGMQAAGAPIPIQKPDPDLKKQAAASTLALQHIANVERFAQDPWMRANVFGPAWGRIMKGEEAVGGSIPGATPQQTRDAQDLLTSLNYLYMREGRALFGGRPPQMMMQKMEETTPGVQMAPERFLGALDGVRRSANMAIAANRGWMFGDTTRPIVAVPAGGRIGTDNKSGRQVMQEAPGQPWRYMDTGEEWKKQ